MAVWFDPVIEFIVKEAHQDMGSVYEDITVVDMLAKDAKMMAMVWNEGEIKTSYNMEQQGVYISAMFEVQIVGQHRRQVGRAMYDFQNALIGSPLSEEHGIAHHNVGGHPIRAEDMNNYGLTDTYRPVAKERGAPLVDATTGAKLLHDNGDELWWPTHIIQKVTVEGEALARHPELDAWRGRIFIHAHIANAGFGGL